MHEKISPLVSGAVAGRKCWEDLPEVRQEIWLQVFDLYYQTAKKVLKGRHNRLVNTEKRQLIETEEPSFGGEGINRMCKCFGKEKGNGNSLCRLANGMTEKIFKGLAWNTENLEELEKNRRKAAKADGRLGVAQGRQWNSRPHQVLEPNTGVPKD